MTDAAHQSETPAHGTLVAKLCFIVIAMFGFGFALVPLYDVFCDLTGLNGKVDVLAANDTEYEVVQNRQISLEFVTSVNNRAPIEFRAETPKLRINPGKYYVVYFRATNTTKHDLIGQAIPSFTPGLAAKYLKKTECFCFSQQTFKPGETKRMPVRFVVDPALPEKFTDVTLAYTFFDVTSKQAKTN